MKRFSHSALIALLVVIAGCGLPSSVRQQIAQEHRHLTDTQQQVEDAQKSLASGLAANVDLFANQSEVGNWNRQIDNAQSDLARAIALDRDLDQLAQNDRRREGQRAEDLIDRANRLENSAYQEAHQAGANVAQWIAYKNDPAALKLALEQVHQRLQSPDFNAVTKKVEAAENDWPAKKATLAARYDAALNLSKNAEVSWQSASSTTAIGARIAAVSTLTDEAASLQSQTTELSGLTDQLYISWDKILIDLDDRNDDYRERIRTVRTHISDVATHESETSSSEDWQTVSKPVFATVKDDLGMSLAHKDAGLFDSEAVNTPQPAGFAYMAPESVGHNQYGYWTHDDGGHSVWTWLPQYLILRELLWNHAYRPVLLDDYRGYRVAQSAGRTYYGTTPATDVPKYGTHGSFTRNTYASSRYVQTGGFGKSGYASHSFGSSSTPARSTSFFSERGAGKRFGGVKPGRSFGRGAGRSFGRGFGRH